LVTKPEPPRLHQDELPGFLPNLGFFAALKSFCSEFHEQYPGVRYWEGTAAQFRDTCQQFKVGITHSNLLIGKWFSLMGEDDSIRYVNVRGKSESGKVNVYQVQVIA